MSRSADKTNIFLTGMMGTGKSSTGRLVANQLRFVFADTDTLIERREALTVSDIFSSYGEEYFRSREREILIELCANDRQVIATGGGMLAQRDSLDLARSSGLVVLLSAPVSELSHRLRYRNDRPLLDGNDPDGKLAAIENERKAVFDTIAHRIETYGQTPAEVADLVIASYRKWLES